MAFSLAYSRGMNLRHRWPPSMRGHALLRRFLQDLGGEMLELEDSKSLLSHPTLTCNRREPSSWGTLPSSYAEAKVAFASRLHQAATLPEGKLLHICVSGYDRSQLFGNLLIRMYGRFGGVREARAIFDRIVRRSFLSWTHMISAYSSNGNLLNARVIFEKMPNKDTVVWNSMISAYAHTGQMQEARSLFESMQLKDISSWNTMISASAQNGQLEDAQNLFDAMPEYDVVSWTAMISAYAQHGSSKDALLIIQKMESEGFRPVKVTFISALDVYASLAKLEQGKAVHARIVESGYELDVVVGTALVSMYGKCGYLDIAWNVFKKISEPDVVSWNAIIATHVWNGHIDTALQLFQEMNREGVKPDKVTFISILDGCSRAGLVDVGNSYFRLMEKLYSIEPSVEHYGCMIDLLGRAGHLVEAEEMITSMPFRSNAMTWMSLLEACKIHGDVECGARAANQIFELDPMKATPYLLLSDIYAAVGRWDDVAKVRKLMRDRGVKRQRGCSYIEIKNKVHEFIAGDTSHEKTEDVNAELLRLSKQIKEAGYFPDTKSVLHDVEEEEKECMLLHHSEKLAISFGLISTPEGTPLRIINNIRMCKDCHSFVKFVSRTVGRKVMVRDVTLFHHIEDGVCSCQDCW